MGDKYYGHTLSNLIDKIEIEPSTRSSTDKSVLHPVKSSGSISNNTTIPQEHNAVNSYVMQENTDLNIVKDIISTAYLKKRNTKEIEAIVKSLDDELSSNGSIEEANISKSVQDISDLFFEEDRTFLDENKELYNYFKVTKIKVPDMVKKQISDFNSFSKSNFGKIRLVKENGTPIDSVYGELNSKFGENFFPITIYSEADMLERISEIASKFKIKTVNAQEYFNDSYDDYLNSIKELIFNKYNGMIKNTISENDVNDFDEFNLFFGEESGLNGFSKRNINDRSEYDGKAVGSQNVASGNRGNGISQIGREDISADYRKAPAAERNQATTGETVNSDTSDISERKGVGAKAAEFPQKQKVSKFRSNTVEHSKMFTQADKELLNLDSYKYDVVGEKQSLELAKQRLQTDLDGEVEDLPKKITFDGNDMDTSMGIAEKYLNEERKTGNYSKTLAWTKMIQEKSTESGQAIQALAKYSRTPEGKIQKAQSVVQEVENEIKAPFDKEKGKYPPNAKPKLWNKIKTETKEITDAVDSASKEAAKKAAELLPEELLAKKIESTTKDEQRKENAISDMVSELFRSAKESPLPKRMQEKRSPVDLLSQAIADKAQYTDVWKKAKNILQEKYANDTEISAILDDYFNKGIVPTYSQQTFNKSINEAVNAVAVDFNKIIKASYGEKEKALTDITNYLIEKTGVHGEDAEMLSKDIYNKYYEILKLNSQKALDKMFLNQGEKVRIQQKTVKEKVLELINLGAYSNNAVVDIIKQNNDLPVLTNDDVKNILDYMDKAKSFSDNSYEHNMWIAKADKIIADKQPATKHDKFRGAQRISMLTNPKTLITRNPGGNIILGAAENIKDFPASLADKLVSLSTKERTTARPSLEVAKAQLGGAKKGMVEWSKDIKNKVDTSPSRGQMELPSKRIFKNKWLNSIDYFVRNSLQLGDRPFYQAAYDGRIAELKRLGKTSEPAELDAKNYALERVLQNDSGLAKRAGEIRKALGYPGDLIMPFTQTPANIMDKLIDYTPLGVAKIAHQLGTEGIKSGKFNQKLFVDRVGRCFTGTGTMMLAFAMAAKGLLTGALDKDEDMRSAQYQAGQQPYSIKLGKNYYSYDWAQPIGGLLAAGADFYTAGVNKDDFLSAVTAGTTTALDTVFNQSFLSGVLDMFGGFSPTAGVFNSLLRSTSQVTPSVMSSLAKTFDPYMRETYDKNVFVEQLNRLASRLPGVSMTLPPKLDGAGKPIKQSQGRNFLLKATENMLSPGKFTTEQHDPVNDEILNVYKKLVDKSDKSVFLPVSKKSFNVGKKNYKLTAKEYEKYSKVRGEYQYKSIQEFMQMPQYKAMSAEDKVSAVYNEVYDFANAYAKKQAVPEYEIPPTQQKNYRIVSDGYNLPAFIMLKRESDIDKNGSISKKEAIAILDKHKELSQTDKAYFFKELLPSVKKNHYE